jgi:ribosomal protein L4
MDGGETMSNAQTYFKLACLGAVLRGPYAEFLREGVAFQAKRGYWEAYPMHPEGGYASARTPAKAFAKYLWQEKQRLALLEALLAKLQEAEGLVAKEGEKCES